MGGAWIGGRLRRGLGRVGRVQTAAIEFLGAVAALGHDLIQPAVQPSHGIREVLRALVPLRPRTLIRVGVSQAFKMACQRFEAFLDRGKFAADGVLAIVWLVWSALVSHVVLRIAEAGDAGNQDATGGRQNP